MRRAVLAAVAIVSVGLAVACGLSVVGVNDDGHATDPDGGGVNHDDGSPPNQPPSEPTDGASAGDGDVPPPPPPCLGDGDACNALQPSAPFATVLYGDRAGLCPADFSVFDVVTNPVPKTGACSCGTCAASATCTTGTIGTKYSTDTTCGNPAGNLNANSGACYPYNGMFVSTYCSIIPPAAVPGPCSAPGVGVPTSVASDPKRLCYPKVDSCATTFCAPPPSLKTCLVAAGDVACPASAPTKTIVGVNVEVACTACTCTSTATCGGAVTFYSSAGCTGTTKVLQANVCTMVNQASIQSTKWAGVVATQQCTNLTPGTPTASLKDKRTVCCAP